MIKELVYFLVGRLSDKEKQDLKDYLSVIIKKAAEGAAAGAMKK